MKIKAERLLFLFTSFAINALAWNTPQELEQEAANRITDDSVFLDANFTSNLVAAADSTNILLGAAAHILLSIQDYDRYLQNDDEGFLEGERNNASNAVSIIGVEKDTWQYWIGRLVHAGAFLSVDDVDAAFLILTNAINEIETSPPNLASNILERKILEKHEMPGVDMATALKILAGATSASMGQRCAATNFAAQIPPFYSTNIMEILNGSY